MTYIEAKKVLESGKWFYELPIEYQLLNKPEGKELLDAIRLATEALDYMDQREERIDAILY